MPYEILAALRTFAPRRKAPLWGISQKGSWTIEIDGHTADVDSDASGWWFKVSRADGRTYHHPQPFKTDGEAKAAALRHIAT